MRHHGTDEERAGMLKEVSLFDTVRKGLKLNLSRPVQPVGVIDEEEHHADDKLLSAHNVYMDSPRANQFDREITAEQFVHRKRVGFAAFSGLLCAIITCCVLLNYIEHSQSFSALPPMQQRVMAAASAAGARETLEFFTSASRHAGSSNDFEWAKYIRSRAIDFGFDESDIKLEEFEVSVNEPEAMSIQMRFSATANISHDLIALYRKKKNTKTLFAPFHLYSRNGSVRGRLVYAHFGTTEDYEALRRVGIDLEESIVLVRLGKISLSAKVLLAGKAGARGILTYDDPLENGHGRGKVAPEGPWLGSDEARFGSVYVGSGDPSTPDGFSSVTMDRISVEEMFSSSNHDNYLPSIISMPISANTARQLMQTMLVDDPNVSTVENATSFTPPVAMATCARVFGSSWTGSGLNLSDYKVGPGNWEMKMENRQRYLIKKVWNVLITLRGSREADRYVIVGSQRDAMYGGASSPGSGNAVFIEILRAMGELLANGWTPHRTILLASFDAEQFGSVGSSEWIDRHSSHLGGRGVAYLGLKSPVRGNGVLHCEAAASLHKSIYYKASHVAQPQSSINSKLFYRSNGKAAQDTKLSSDMNATAGSFHDDMNASYSGLELLNTTFKPENLANAKDTVYSAWLDATRAQNPKSILPKIHLPGTSDTISPFLTRLGIPSMEFFFDNGYYAVENTAQDTFTYMKNFVDPSFSFHRASAQMYGSLILTFSDSIFLQYDFVEVARQLRYGQAYLRVMLSKYTDFNAVLKNIMQRLDIAIKSFENSAIDVVKEMNVMTEDMTNIISGELVVDLKKVREVNTRLLMTEKAFVLPSGLPHMPWLKHILYGITAYEDYQVGFFPGVSMQIYYSDNVIPVRRELVRLCQAIEQAADTLSTTVL